MKRILFVLSMLVGIAHAQTTGFFRYDTVAFQKVGGNSEFNLYNSTRNLTNGILINKGTGRTAFSSLTGSKNATRDSMIFTLGTLRIAIKDSTGGGSITASQGLFMSGNDVQLGGISPGVGISGVRVINGHQTSTTQNFPLLRFDSMNLELKNHGGEMLVMRQGYAKVSANVPDRAYTQWFPSPGWIYNFALDSFSVGVGGAPSASPTYLSLYNNQFYAAATTGRMILGAGTYADQYAVDSIIWRLTNRDASLTFNSDGWHAWQKDGEYYFYNVKHAINATEKMVTIDTVTGELHTRAISSGGSQGLQDVITVDNVTTGNNTIVNGANTLTVTNNTLSGAQGVILSSSSTAAIASQTMLTSLLTGTNANSGIASFGFQGISGRSGTTSENTGVFGQAVDGATSNIGVWGQATDGVLAIGGKFEASGASNNFSVQLVDGTEGAGKVLTSDATGRASWATPSGSSLTVGTTAIASGTTTRILYDNAGTLGEYPITGTGNVVLATSPTIGNYTLSGAGTSGAVTVTNTASDFIIGNGVATATFRLLPFGTDIFFDNPVAGDQVFRTNVTERMRIANSTGVISGSIFSGTTGFRVNNAAASRKMLVGNGTNFVASTETWAVPGTTGNVLTSDGTNWVSSAPTLTGTATLNFDLSAVNSQDLTLTVTGAASGDAVALGLDPASVSADITFFGWVSATNTVTIRCSRVGGGGAVDPASGTFRARVIKF